MIDAMETQTVIAEKIRVKKADYILTLRGDQGTLNENKDVKENFINVELRITSLQLFGKIKIQTMFSVV